LSKDFLTETPLSSSPGLQDLLSLPSASVHTDGYTVAKDGTAIVAPMGATEEGE